MSTMEEGHHLAQICHDIVNPVSKNEKHDNSYDIPSDHCSLKEESENKIYCNACRSDSGKSLAVGRCLSCTFLLCRACVFAHKFMICFQGHNVIPLADICHDSLLPNDKNSSAGVQKATDYEDNKSSCTNQSTSYSNNEDLYNLIGHPSLSTIEASHSKDEKHTINVPPHTENGLRLKGMNFCQSISNESDRQSSLCNLISNLNINRNSTSTLQNQIQQHSSQNIHRQIESNLNGKSDMAINCQSVEALNCLNNPPHLTDQSDSLLTKNISARCSSDLLMILEKTSNAMQIQYWKAALKINETIGLLKDELAQKKHCLINTLDDAYDKEHKKILQLAKEFRNNPVSIDLQTRLEIMRCCDQVLSNDTTLFDFVAENQNAKKLIRDGSGQLNIRHLFNNEKISQWSTEPIDQTLSSGYESMSLSQNNSNRMSSYLYQHPSSLCPDAQYEKQNNSFAADISHDQTNISHGSRPDVVSHWSLSDNSCYWLQDPCWNSDSYSLFPSTNTYQSDIKKVRQISDIIEPALPCISKAIEAEESSLSLSPGGLQGRYTDLATCSIQSPDPSLSVGSCCCGNRPISSIRRQKMVYHCKFGEFGGLDGQFTEPSGVAVNLESDIIVADTNNHRIQVFDRDGRYKFRFGECGKRDGQLLYPNRVAVFKLSGDIVVTERSPTHQVQIFNENGTFVRKFGSTVLQHPRGVCVDPSGNIIVAECKVMRVFVFDRFGNAISRFNCSKHLEFPNSVCANDKQEIFISDNRAHCVKVFSYDGRLIRIIGGEGITNFPIGVGLDSSSNILVADNHNNFNLTLFSQSGQLLAALESKVKHAQCFDAAIMDSCGSVVLSSKDYHIYIYRYIPLSYLPTDNC